MPRVKTHHAVTTRGTIADIWAQVELEGEIILQLRERKQYYLYRNKLYAHRSALRRSALAHTGISACSLDPFKPSLVEADGKFYLVISRRDEIDITVLLPKEPKPPPLIDEFVLTHKSEPKL